MRAYLEREFGDVLETSNGRDLRINCPFCGKDDSGHHMYVNVQQPIAHCFRCGWKGTYIQFVKQYAGTQSIHEVKELLSQRHKVTDFESIADRLDRKKKAEKQQELAEMPAWFVPFSSGLQVGRMHIGVLQYALKRMSYDAIHAHSIGYCNDLRCRESLRMIIPIERGYYQARAIGSSKPKYVNPSFPLNERLFNYKALDRYSGVIICEGVISAIATGSNAVATLGNKANKDQKERLANSSVTSFTIAYDAGEEYSNATLELADYLTRHGKQVFIRKYAYGDPDSCDEFTEEEYSYAYKIQAALKSKFNPKFCFSN